MKLLAVRCRRLARVLLLLGLILLGSCSLKQDYPAVSTAIQRFHEQMKAQQDEAIYEESDDLWKQTVTRENHAKFLSMIRRKLGSLKSTEPPWPLSINYSGAGAMFVLRCKAHYQKGDAEEVFTFHVVGSQPKLVGVQVNSPLMME